MKDLAEEFSSRWENQENLWKKLLWMSDFKFFAEINLAIEKIT